MKLGLQLTVCWMIAISIGGAYAGISLLSNSTATYDVAGYESTTYY